MKTEIKTRWIAALRSGEYKQGYGHLRTMDNCYCALGVLCDLYSKDENRQWTTMRMMFDDGEGTEPRLQQVYVMYHPHNDQYSVSVPQLHVGEWAGMQCNPFVKAKSPYGVMNQYRLSEVNDVLKYTFDQIADIIEAEL